VGGLVITLVPGQAQAVDKVPSLTLRQGVTVGGILAHERVLQRIANQNGGTRASGTPGYGKSATYVINTMKRAGYNVRKQKFLFPFFRELAPATLSQTAPSATDYETATLEYSGSGSVSGTVVPIDVTLPPPAEPGSTSGCEPGDFPAASASADQVALVQRGTCTFAIKAANAAAAGYDAVVVFNEGQAGRTELLAGTLGAPTGIPVVGLSFADGASLAAAAGAGPVTVEVSTSTESKNAKTWNVIASTKTGDPRRTVIVGAHLDSVVEGPGINDNGSGTAALLEIGQQMAKLEAKPRQRVRFAFWGAEESGLLGSTHYVESLSNLRLNRVKANLNFDMIGSPNFVRFVYDGNGSAGGPVGPPGSGQIERIFNRYFNSRGYQTSPTEFNGRSDYGPFIAAGIPAGGLFSGAEGVKTPEEAAVYGGTAGEAYDACYHQACDNINNLSTRALNQLGDAAAHAVWTLARTKTGFFGDGSLRSTRKVAARSLDYAGSHAIR
jgi:Zn-dependent M28 family amino/carboxypeptidase